MNIYPVLTPVLALLKSRKGIVWLVTIIGGIALKLIPSLQPVGDELIFLLCFAALTITGGIAGEDIAKFLREKPPQAVDPVQAFKELLEAQAAPMTLGDPMKLKRLTPAELAAYQHMVAKMNEDT